uniref:Uncharacterized protein n=1 Tax=Romanomermis culicivorax TaxID=13658 RepID=A0A915JS44_ROMCU
FHLLDGLEPSPNIKLEPRQHIFCVFGDNWLQEVKFSLKVSLADTPSVELVDEILQLEMDMVEKKKEMSQFQTEFMNAKRAYESAVEKLEKETKDIKAMLKKRQQIYDNFVKSSETKCAPLPAAIPRSSSNGGGLFKVSWRRIACRFCGIFSAENLNKLKKRRSYDLRERGDGTADFREFISSISFVGDPVNQKKPLNRRNGIFLSLFKQFHVDFGWLIIRNDEKTEFSRRTKRIKYCYELRRCQSANLSKDFL